VSPSVGALSATKFTRRLAAPVWLGSPTYVVRRRSCVGPLPKPTMGGEGASSDPCSRTRRFAPSGFCFAFIGRGEPLMLPLRFKATLFGRVGKSRRPPPLEPSLKVHRDIAHNQSSGFAVAHGVRGLNARGQRKVHPKWRMFELCPGFYGLSKATFHSPTRCSPHFRRLRAAICSPLGAEMGRIKGRERPGVQVGTRPVEW
jgi:hypothetical protein